MIVTLTSDIIVNDGKRGVFRKKGDHVEVTDGDARVLIANKQAVERQPDTSKKGA